MRLMCLGISTEDKSWQNVVIRSGENEFEGTISFTDVKAQYTPKDMQTSANKIKQV